MIEKKKLLILYDWFYPGFRAGGPIQSLTNLVLLLIPHFDIYVITGTRDLNSSIPYPGVILNSWNYILLPGSNSAIKVFYAEKKTLNTNVFQHFFEDIHPSVVYLNGIFSFRFFLLPLLALKKIKADIKVVLCPRGMLKKGALSSKAFKKKAYLNFLKIFGLLKNVSWHATTADELADIKKHFLITKGSSVAPNIPKKPFPDVPSIKKNPGELKLVYLSLINEHKNLLLLLEMIGKCETGVSLDIYGPIVDEVYWQKCMSVLEQMQGKVCYKGVVEPHEVQAVLSKYHVFILFTKGENFGHAIYESLSIGRPVITSRFTPWQKLDESRAGANVNFDDQERSIEKINDFVKLEQDDYNIFCASALHIAIDYYQKLEAGKKYINLFT
ncbi:MAG TPA: glycosyltransferase [Segetibacter sp.]|nr:glycosyltransferase [Segetibacter sp.]